MYCCINATSGNANVGVLVGLLLLFIFLSLNKQYQSRRVLHRLIFDAVFVSEKSFELNLNALQV